MPIIENILTLSPDTPIELFEVSGYNLSNLNETLRICNYLNVSFSGQSYQAIGCESEGFDLIGQGSVPTPSLTVSNVNGVVSNWLYQCKTLPNYRIEGSTVKRRITQKQFLDGEPNQNASIKEFPQQIYVIEQVAKETYLAVEFRLGSPFDVDTLTLPSRHLVRSCTWRYRSPECGYMGAGYTINNQPTTNPALDVCAKTLLACETRFGVWNDLPFGGAPGLNTYS